MDEQWTGVAKNKNIQMTTFLFTFLFARPARRLTQRPRSSAPTAAPAHGRLHPRPTHRQVTAAPAHGRSRSRPSPPAAAPGRPRPRPSSPNAVIGGRGWPRQPHRLPPLSADSYHIRLPPDSHPQT